ncbi:MAG: hypothetical protein M1840_005694 [Geoglossum simile]|nr:MAG: hypothetical protein M1840_005694 [Geoglossum simile]
MAPPSPLTIATSSLLRLIKEEASYHKELQQQETRIQKLTAQDQSAENVEFMLRQERKVLEETKAVFPRLRQRINEGLGNLQELIKESPREGNDAEVRKAEDAVVAAKKSIGEGEAVS